ncbi:Uncharacterised protein [Vibrio parahaemolyticus]|nr:Uncharacterised protein [Vibrio parahaemolyticus]
MFTIKNAGYFIDTHVCSLFFMQCSVNSYDFVLYVA